jgi:PAS domain S-box-containing protein
LIFKITNISVDLLITSFVNFFTLTVSWQRRRTRYGSYFVWGMLGVTLWTLASAFDYAAVSIPLKVFFAKWEYTGYNFALVFFVMFALTYAGQQVWLKRRWVRALLILIPISNLLLVWTNELHGWVWSGFSLSAEGDNIVIFHHGPGFIWEALTGYLMILTVVVFLWRASRKGPELLRRQARLIFLASVLPIAANLIYLFNIPAISGVDWTSITFSVSGLFFLVALYGTRFLDIVPIARDTLVERMTDGVLVLDANNQVVDFNLAAQSIFGINKQQLGLSILDVLASWPEVTARLMDSSGTAVHEISIGDPEKIFDLQLTALEDARGKRNGQLVVIRDISEHKRMEKDLRLSEEKFYKAFHSSPDAISITRLEDGQIMDVNDGFCRLIGIARSEALADSTIHLGIWADPHDREEVVLQLQQSGQVREREIQYRTKSGDVLTGIYSGEVIRLDNQAYIISTIHDITRRKLAEKQLLDAQLQLMAHQREMAVDEERQRMARDLHDSVSQSIHSLVLFAETLAATLEKNNLNRAREIAGRLQESARQAHKEARLLLYEYQSPGSDRTVDLVGDLEQRLSTVERRSGIRATIFQEGSLENYPQVGYENLFWITIEALNNSLKYAQAHNLQISLRSNATFFELEISDDGIGFDPQKTRVGGMGMRSMRERAGLLGGQLQIISSSGNGTRVCVTINKDGS